MLESAFAIDTGGIVVVNSSAALDDHADAGMRMHWSMRQFRLPA